MTIASIFNPPFPVNAEQPVLWQHLPGASLALAISCLVKNIDRPVLIIAPDNLYVSHLLDELHFFSASTNTLQFPDWETLPYDHFSPHQDIISARLQALNGVPKRTSGAIITTAATVMQKLPPLDYVIKYSFMLAVGDKLNLDTIRHQLTKVGYHAVTQAREHGEFAIRGSIIDLFPMGSDVPYRIDLFDDEVDSIRIYSPETQLSLEKVDDIHLLPAKEYPFTEETIDYFRHRFREHFPGNPLKCPLYQDISEGICPPGIEYYLPLFFEQLSSFFDYLPENTLIITIGNLQTKAEEFWHEITTRYEQGKHNILHPLLDPNLLFNQPAAVMQSLVKFNCIKVNSEEHTRQTFSFNTHAAPSLEINHKAAVPLQALQNYIKTNTGRLLFCAETMGRREVLLQLFSGIDFRPTFFNDWPEFLASSDKHGIVVAPIEEGFVLKEPELTLLTESHLYGKRVMQRRLRKRASVDPDAIIRDLAELQINDPVVHIDHGIGRYLGLQTLTVGDQIAEFLTLEYQGGDKLYVPVASLHLISRYTGADAEHTPLHKLGTEQWAKAKRKAAEQVKDVAVELLDLYAKRASRPGMCYDIPQDQYDVFASQFPFEETPDQLQAIEQVFADMASSKPMDRVICGDVGFGKTEVALRAAFIAVQNGKQVAILVPTTLLAQQHYQNFQDRFADWPIKVAMLSRFKTNKEQKDILLQLEEGKVDVVIGTHKLLQSDIKFKNLGLVIIDEEHRFGVKQKDKLKALRSMVDILTLTATPIPRTLNMSLAGIRDLSVIATPPLRRLSVKTFVHEYRDDLIREAIQREILRGGQVYFLHNDVATINRKAEDIKKLVPESRPCVAHGQMHERDLERVMSEFYHRQHNVLICSTIIESGIDIPTANTIIINRADKFGIAQLHQLRGRVGRSHHQAYAYLLTPPRDMMTSDALKRLDAIASLDALGIGFTLATHDLEIRGAGELLGEQQSGDIEEIGFTLYMELLSKAVDSLKHGKEFAYEECFSIQCAEVDLHITALIPETYLPDVHLRLSFYKRIASAKTITELDEIQVEMIDRFGLLPEPLKNLFAITEMKITITELGIKKIEASNQGGKIEFMESPKVKPETIIRLLQDKSGKYRMDGPTRLRFGLDNHELKERISKVDEVIKALSV